jgi:phosphatidate cytidylyltransferase
MNNFLERFLLFVIGLPLLLALIIFTAPYAHIGWFLVVLVFAFLGTREIYPIFSSLPLKTAEHGEKVPESRSRRDIFVAFLGSLLLLAAYADVLWTPDPLLFPLVLIAGIVCISLTALLEWKSANKEGTFVRDITAGIGALVYPSFFAVFLVLLSALNEAQHLVLLFLVLGFGNDTFAYLTGKFLAKRSGPPLLAVSPNKTLVGFIGGFLGALALGYLYVAAVPDLLGRASLSHGIFFLVIAVFGNLGDLLESALKRSAALKDSGSIIPGRGGVLDSIDSLLFSAPVYYYSIIIFFT